MTLGGLNTSPGDNMAPYYRITIPALTILCVALPAQAEFPELELSPRVIGEEVVQPSYPNSNAIAFDVGEASLYPALSVQVGSNDNLFAEVDETGATDSTQLTLAPRFDYIATGAKQTVWLGYLGEYGQHADASQADYQDHRLSLISHTAFDSRRRLDVEASVAQSHQSIGSGRTTEFSAVEIDALSEVDTFRISKISAAFSFGNPAVKGELVGGLGGGSIAFISNEADTAQYDRDFSIVWSKLYYRLSPRMRVVGSLAHRSFDYDGPYVSDGRERDSTTNTVSAGVVREISDLWYGRVDLRNRSQDFDDPTLEDNDGVLIDAKLFWLWKRYSRFELGLAEREFVSVLGPGVAKFRSVSLTWRHDWNDRLSSVVKLESVERDESDESLNSDYSQSGVELRFAPRRWLRVLGGYRKGAVGRLRGDADQTEIYFGAEANI